jgi:hypothetical protein
MTPEQKIKKWLLLKAVDDEFQVVPEQITAENVNDYWNKLVEEDSHWDLLSEFRSGQVETGLDSPYSRHYEAKEVAAQMDDGSWVGWTYWYGGGKHGCPEEIDWMEDAYDLEVTEEEKTLIVKTWKKLK